MKIVEQKMINVVTKRSLKESEVARVNEKCSLRENLSFNWAYDIWLVVRRKPEK